MSARCTGHCCQAFFLPYTLEELRALALREPNNRDAQTISAMVIPLNRVPRELWDCDIAWENANADHFFTCKNLLPNGDCGVYETRPDMCKRYPYGRTCEMKGCTMAQGLTAISKAG